MKVRSYRGSPGLALLATLGGCLLLLVVAGCAGSADSIGDRLEVTFGTFDQLPLTAEEAVAAGWIGGSDCVDRLGRVFHRAAADPNDVSAPTMMGSRANPLMLLMDSNGDIIGFQLMSLSPQPVPPWEYLQQGHMGMNFEHWSMHVYLRDPAKAC